MTPTTDQVDVVCTHCGDRCRDDSISLGQAVFCCSGCKAVYELLHHAELEAYYSQQEPPGIKPPETVDSSRFAYLDDPEIKRQLISFSDGTTSRATFSVPQIHCSSCIWLLENLYRLHSGIVHSQVNFLRREVTIRFLERSLTLRQLVELLTRLGYEPPIRLESLSPKHAVNPRRSLHLKVGVAGFCFGNIMLLSFPDYINSQELERTIFPLVFRYLVLALSLPVLLYSAKDYFQSAWLAIRSRVMTIDFPLAIGLAALFLRSLYDIVSGSGPGYLDSFSGLTFFLLLGKVFQQRTYEQLSFERDYKAYFPASITRKVGDTEVSIPITQLAVGERIIVRNHELVPADSILIRGDGLIDYSFVTGESEAHAIASGSTVYAGGRQVGTAIELEVVKEVSQSYLTSLWNNAAFQKKAQPLVSLADRAGKYFITTVLFIAAATAVYWLRRDTDIAMNAVTSVLIVACPCAIALASPFVLGTALRVFGRHKLYLKNISTVESLSRISAIVFDKTGTLTHAQPSDVQFEGTPLTEQEVRLVKSVVRHSTHPVSRRIDSFLPEAARETVEKFMEEPGNGIAGVVGGVAIRLGRYGWINPGSSASHNGFKGEGTVSYLSIDNVQRGKFILSSSYRNGLERTVTNLKGRYSLEVLSGDNDRDRTRLAGLFGDKVRALFNQSPHEKLAHLSSIESTGARTLMVGDGLNDAGALRVATVGIAVSEDAVNFTPACDGILEASALSKLDQFLALARASRRLVIISFVISILYNIVGLSFAVSGHLSPLVSAILMPVSSVTVVAFATISTQFAARRIGLK